MDAGFTLLECTVVLMLVAVAAGLGVGSLAGHRDRWAVVGAREAAAGLFARARIEAVGSGGSTVSVHEDRARLERRTGDVVHERLLLDRDRGVSIDLPGSADSAVVRFDALGLGVLASRTIHFRRGTATASIVLSSYGRMSRR